MNSSIFPSIPLETAKAARAVFGRSNFYLEVGDQANFLFEGLNLGEPRGKTQAPSRTEAILYMITIFQFIETLPDNQATDALRERIDWKYALHLPLNYPGMQATSLCEFRQWLLVEQAGQQTFQLLLSRLPENSKITGGQDSGLNSVQVITDVCQFSRLAKIWESLHQAMQALATRRPDWLLLASLPHWYERYDSHHRNINLRVGNLEKHTLAQSIGADGMYMLDAISKADSPDLADLDEILALRKVWREQFECEGGKAMWRKKVCAGCPLPDKLPVRP